MAQIKSEYQYGILLKKIDVLMDITQAKLAEFIGVSASKVSEYLTGKSEPTLQVAKNLHQKLNINPYIILQ